LYFGHHCPHDHALQVRYGITCDQWNELLIFQRGRCAVCGRLEGNGRRFVLDHDHETGEVGGLTHFGCNRPISQRVRRYLADPPGRALGLVVPADRMVALEQRNTRKTAAARKARAAERNKVTPVTGNAVSFGERTEAALRATGGN
jgi:hypothetical protein